MAAHFLPDSGVSSVGQTGTGLFVPPPPVSTTSFDLPASFPIMKLKTQTMTLFVNYLRYPHGLFSNASRKDRKAHPTLGGNMVTHTAKKLFGENIYHDIYPLVSITNVPMLVDSPVRVSMDYERLTY